MYHIPEFFKPEEIFSKAVIEVEGKNNPGIWRLMDSRVLWTADQLRLHFCGNQKKNSPDIMIVNDWSWGGKLQLRGFRDLWYDIILPQELYSVTSQHVYGRALDFHFKHTTAEEVRQDIKRYKGAERYKYITAIEDKTEWIHFDSRNWDTNRSGLLIFNRG